MAATSLTGARDALTDKQRAAWQDAVGAVDEIASATDSESGSKQPLEALRQRVRTHPAAVVNDLGSGS